MSLRSITINLSKIPKERIFTGKTGDKYITLDESDKREPDQYGKEISLSIAQTKEEREARASKIYVGDGKWVFRDSPPSASPSASSAYKDTAPQQGNDRPPQDGDPDDLPF